MCITCRSRVLITLHLGEGKRMKMRKIILIQLTLIVTFYLICCLYLLSFSYRSQNISRNIISCKFRFFSHCLFSPWTKLLKIDSIKSTAQAFFKYLSSYLSSASRWNPRCSRRYIVYIREEERRHVAFWKFLRSSQQMNQKRYSFSSSDNAYIRYDI